MIVALHPWGLQVRETSRFNIWDPKTWTSQYRAKTYDEVRM